MTDKVDQPESEWGACWGRVMALVIHVALRTRGFLSALAQQPITITVGMMTVRVPLGSHDSYAIITPPPPRHTLVQVLRRLYYALGDPSLCMHACIAYTNQLAGMGVDPLVLIYTPLVAAWVLGGCSPRPSGAFRVEAGFGFRV